MRVKMGYAEALGVSRCEALRLAGLKKLGGAIAKTAKTCETSTGHNLEAGSASASYPAVLRAVECQRSGAGDRMTTPKQQITMRCHSFTVWHVRLLHC